MGRAQQQRGRYHSSSQHETRHFQSRPCHVQRLPPEEPQSQAGSSTARGDVGDIQLCGELMGVSQARRARPKHPNRCHQPRNAKTTCAWGQWNLSTQGTGAYQHPVSWSPWKKRLQTPGRASHRCDEKCHEAAALGFFTCARAFDVEQRPRVLHFQPVFLIAGLIWIVHASVHVFAFVRMFPRRLTPPFPSLPATLRCSSQK